MSGKLCVPMKQSFLAEGEKEEGKSYRPSSSSSARSMKIVAASDDLGASLKDSLVAYLRLKGIHVQDLGLSPFHTSGRLVGELVSSSSASHSLPHEQTLGLCFCATDFGTSIFANKFPGVYAASCLSVDDAKNARSINNCNVLTLGAKLTSEEQGEAILDAWLETPFKSPCPANDGKPWSPDMEQFLDESLVSMAKIPPSSKEAEDSGGGVESGGTAACALCNLASTRAFEPVDIFPGCSMTIVRQDPTSAIVRFKAGSLEPAHHHTFGHDLIVTYGQKRVWNITKNQAVELGPGDFLYTPAGDVHRVQYLTDTEFFIKWDGHWDIFLDEDLSAAAKAVHGNKEFQE